MKPANEITFHKFKAWHILLHQFKNPLLLIFLISTIVSFTLGQKFEALAIWLIMLISVSLGFINEYQAEKIVQDLMKKISYTTTIIRNGIKEIIPIKEVSPDDIVVLYPGSIIPADLQIIDTKNLEIDESVLTGESLPVIKTAEDLAFMGTIVASGTGQGKVTAIGNNTKFGKISMSISQIRPETEFQKGLRNFSSMLTKIAGITVALIIIFNWILGRSMVETVMFALTIAMGITPELLPLIVTVTLAHGARKMAKDAIIIKQFVSIEDLGNMDVICTDKTGTITEGNIALESYLNIQGQKDNQILNLALICNNALVHKQIFGDAIDSAIWSFAQQQKYQIPFNFKRLYTSAFDYEKRFMYSLVKTKQEILLICKGAPETILQFSNLDNQQKKDLLHHYLSLQNSGMRIICIAYKKMATDKISYTDIANLDFAGYLTLTDIPKKGIRETLNHLASLGVKVKIVTGDNEITTQKICRDVGFIFHKILLGSDLDKLNDSDLENIVWQTDIFARVTPIQKLKIIKALKIGNHTVGFLGDGINDSPALHEADVGISVNTAVDVAKDAASIVLLHKSLQAIAKGITEGRKTFQNTIKYILMGTSSNFGNMFSAAIASVFLPFLPMLPIQVLLTDMLYDFSQFSLPTDNVDPDQLHQPKHWDLHYIQKFMLFFGSLSSIYDLITFALMFYVFNARSSLFQTGWFVESLITEVMVVFVIRTHRVPFFKSHPSKLLVFTCLSIVIIGILLPFSPVAGYLQFTPLPPLYFLFLIILTVTYLGLVELGKILITHKHIAKIKLKNH